MADQMIEYLIRVPADNDLVQQVWDLAYSLNEIVAEADHCRRIVVDPNPGYDGEFRFGTDDILCRVIKAVEETAGADLGPLESLIDYGSVADDYSDALTVAWQLAELAVKEWGYLGPNGADETLIINAWDSGQLDFLQAWVKDEADDSER